jgi:hypothetical protein
MKSRLFVAGLAATGKDNLPTFPRHVGKDKDFSLSDPSASN